MGKWRESVNAEENLPGKGYRSTSAAPPDLPQLSSSPRRPTRRSAPAWAANPCGSAAERRRAILAFGTVFFMLSNCRLDACLSSLFRLRTVPWNRRAFRGAPPQTAAQPGPNVVETPAHQPLMKRHPKPTRNSRMTHRRVRQACVMRALSPDEEAAFTPFKS